jgi:hypothetical protein
MKMHNFQVGLEIWVVSVGRFVFPISETPLLFYAPTLSIGGDHCGLFGEHESACPVRLDCMLIRLGSTVRGPPRLTPSTSCSSRLSFANFNAKPNAAIAAAVKPLCAPFALIPPTSTAGLFPFHSQPLKRLSTTAPKMSTLMDGIEEHGRDKLIDGTAMAQ